MKKIIITNNKKVHSKFADKADVKMLPNATRMKILMEGRSIAEKGGKLLQDPASGFATHYKSLVFYMDGDLQSPDEKSLAMLDRCIVAANKAGSPAITGKEPILSGLLQSKDLDTVKKVFG